MRGNTFQKQHFTALFIALLAGCSGNQSMLASVGPEAERIVKLWWLLFSISLFVMMGIVISLFLSHLRVKQNKTPVEDKKLGKAIILSTGVTTLLLIIIFLATLEFSGPVIKEDTKPSLTIEVTGHRWWWAIKYFDHNNNFLFESANEIYLPTKTPVLFKLKSADVIHSFWVPNIAGKVDMIPGMTNELTVHVDKEGTFRGQCAEFCGIQHAFMSLFVMAMKQEEFNEWLLNQQGPAFEPIDKLALRGQHVFKEAKCITCHSIKGFNAAVKEGPDLTRLGLRSTLAAATIPNRKGHLAGWITDPQSIKPGNLMPSTPIDPEDLQALLHYLENLR